ncbi:MAG: flagellar type III secretion system pore protein FliP, partial [Phycisphaerales bacterium]
LVAVVAAMSGSTASAQMGPPTPDQFARDRIESTLDSGLRASSAQPLTPVGVLDSAGDLLSVMAGAQQGAAIPAGDGVMPQAQGGLSTTLNIILLLTVLTLAPAIMVMCTCFVRIIVVLGLLKQALGAQGLPPSQVITGLALFMTFFVMAPTFERVYDDAIAPYQRGEITNQLDMWNRAKQPLRDFMFDQIEASGNMSSVFMMLNYRGVDTSEPEKLTRADVDTVTLVPAFMLSELKVAFTMGFRVYLPFLVIDMVISSLLISMSMMMLPPVLISLPFKLLLFVLVDGWNLIVGSLMTSFVQPGQIERLSNVAAGAVGMMGGG